MTILGGAVGAACGNDSSQVSDPSSATASADARRNERDRDDVRSGVRHHFGAGGTGVLGAVQRRVSRRWRRTW